MMKNKLFEMILNESYKAENSDVEKFNSISTRRFVYKHKHIIKKKATVWLPFLFYGESGTRTHNALASTTA